MARRAYRIDTLRLVVEAPTEQMAGCLDSLLSSLAVNDDGRHDWRVDVEIGDVLPDIQDARTVWEGDMPEGLRAVMKRSAAGDLLHVTGRMAVVTLPKQKHTRAVILPGHEKVLRGTPSIHMIAETIHGAGLFVLHAACLLHPERDECLVIFAPSGTGKTTTSLALARAGWRLMGDDVTILDTRKGAPLTWALPRWLTVHRKTEAMMPWLSTVMNARAEKDEQSVPFARIAELVAHAEHRPFPCSTVLILQPPNGQGHSAGPLPRDEALMEVMADNLRIAPYGLVERELSFLDALTQMINAARTLRLSAGPDLATLGEFVARACGDEAGLRREAPAG